MPKGINNQLIKQVLKNCLKCHKSFSVQNYRKDIAKYCSRSCQNRCIRIDYHHTEETKQKLRKANLGQQFDKKCLVCQGKFIVNTSHVDAIYCSMVCYGKSKLGKPSWNKDKKLTQEHIDKLVKSHVGIKMPPRTIEHRINMALARKGEKSHFWQGGVSEENKRIRNGVDFKLWREAVFARDNWTCQECGVRGVFLHPHHIKPFAYYPELRFAIDNGQTLCKLCHFKTDTYGSRVFVKNLVELQTI